MAPRLVIFCSAFILDETYDSRLLIFWAVSKLLASDWPPYSISWREFKAFSHAIFLGVRVKIRRE